MCVYPPVDLPDYLIDPRPEMLTNDRLREQIRDFQAFLVKDLWHQKLPANKRSLLTRLRCALRRR